MATTIREATVADLPAVLAMFRTFVQSQAYREYIGDNPEKSAAFLTFLMTSADATIFVSEKAGAIIGMLGLMVYDHPMSGERVGSETFWWLNPEHRGYGGWLLRRGERWAKARGVKRLQMMAPAGNTRVALTYERLGYARVEVIFQKDLV